MSTKSIDLPEVLVLIARREEPNGKLAFIKPRSPEGKDLAVAFTDQSKAQHFVVQTSLRDASLSLVELGTGEVLEGLLASGEVDICINPLDESETYLRYDEPNAIERRGKPDDDAVEVCRPKEELEPALLRTLSRVATEIPVIERIWHLEINERDAKSSARTLLVLGFVQGTSQDSIDQTFMTLGIDWCETLPRGMAVDMMPLEAVPAGANVTELKPIYQRG
ncbi:MAG: enhanced serine sensitivity protein SseB C-terminal domain-containing protein [Planctomycetes bacterium]|nr:enhanced serine sensitivity protein SseB C-terminal domain-containing protein [Planctomycetota bacterium]